MVSSRVQVHTFSFRRRIYTTATFKCFAVVLTIMSQILFNRKSKLPARRTRHKENQCVLFENIILLIVSR